MVLNNIDIEIFKELDFKASYRINRGIIIKNPCIYCIYNMINSKFYLGSAVNLKRRLKKHRRDVESGKHHSIKFQRAFDKYGYDNFKVLVIEESDLENLKRSEEYYLKLLEPFDSGYNICKSYRGRLGLKNSQETRMKISKALTGKKLSEEHKLKLQASSRIGITGIATKDPRLRKVEQIYNGVTINTFDCVSDAGRHTKISRSAISNVLCKRAMTAGNYSWKYIN